MNRDKQRVNIDIDRFLWQQVGIRAAVEGVHKREIVEQALLEYLSKGDNETCEKSQTQRK
jgi:hypothetical protein